MKPQLKAAIARAALEILDNFDEWQTAAEIECQNAQSDGPYRFMMLNAIKDSIKEALENAGIKL